ncbi:MAG: ABC transporter ATP-binding protein, partial [Deltaproteobacteria bacterium]|nr:ABC transporter ATP-binding protein [Deltaproteobacteria bacterium]
QVAEKVMVMLNGKIVEAGSAADIFHKPQHDYTKKLLAAIPALEKGRIARVLDEKNCLEVKNLVKHFPIGGGFFSKSKQKVHAVNGVSFQIPKGQTLSLVGESGCGKTTLGMMVLRLLEADQGEIFFGHQDVRKLSAQEFRPLRAKMQMIFQDPFSSLNPRMRAGEIIEEPFLIHKRGTKEERRQKTLDLLNHVGLKESDYNKYPHEFSGGQRQRIGIARAIALKPDLIVCDEPLSALDVSIQADILKLLKDLQKEFHLTYLFISHDLKVVSQISDWIAVMYLGKIVEQFPASRIFEAKHPYTQALLKAVPIPDPNVKSAKSSLLGDVPSPIQLPTGCSFHPRCPYKEDLCVHTEPLLKKEQTDDHIASCHFTNKVPNLF